MTSPDASDGHVTHPTCKTVDAASDSEYSYPDYTISIDRTIARLVLHLDILEACAY